MRILTTLVETAISTDDIKSAAAATHEALYQAIDALELLHDATNIDALQVPSELSAVFSALADLEEGVEE